MQPDQLAAVRDLHKPVGEWGLTCSGCDVEGWEAESPSWPCRTASLVYSDGEIAAAEAEAESARAERVAQRASDPRSAVESLIPDVWGEHIMKALQTPLDHRLFLGGSDVA